MDINFFKKKKNSDEFLTKLKKTNENNVQITENGAVGYNTTHSKLVDFNFLVSSFRQASPNEISNRFIDMYFENECRAAVYLFYLRNIRGGLGERRTFRICFTTLCTLNEKLAISLLKFIPEFGRWDDLFYVYNKTSNERIDKKILEIVVSQFYADLRIVNVYTTIKVNEDKKPISLLGKWLPSESCKNIDKIRFKDDLIKELSISHKEYRLSLTALRNYLEITEVKMSNKEWDNIDYSKVPSRANLLYNNAFLRNDLERRTKYLEEVKSGKNKMNAGVLYPHDIIHKYASNTRGFYGDYMDIKMDEGLENLWKEMSKKFSINNNENILCVCDTSYSMNCTIDLKSKVSGADVAFGLSIFFSEKISGPFKNNIMTFSESPKLMDLSMFPNLVTKYQFLLNHVINSNTDIGAVFALILKTAIEHNMSQEELPETILIISDMEFDYGTCDVPDKALFEMISDKYKSHGYKLPKLIFWNVNSRSKAFPLTENENGIILLSGFSPNICNMIVSNELDPLTALLKELDNEVYDKIRNLFI